MYQSYLDHSSLIVHPVHNFCRIVTCSLLSQLGNFWGKFIWAHTLFVLKKNLPLCAQVSLILVVMTCKNMKEQVSGRITDIMTSVAGASSLWSDSPYTGSSGNISPSHVWITLCIFYGASK